MQSHWILRPSQQVEAYLWPPHSKRAYFMVLQKLFLYTVIREMPRLTLTSQRRQWHPSPVLLPGKSHGQRSLVGCSHGVAKCRTRLSDFTFPFHLHALEKETATHSSVLAWRIPGMGEPGGLPSMGSHRVRHYWSDLAAAAAHLPDEHCHIA